MENTLKIGALGQPTGDRCGTRVRPLDVTCVSRHYGFFDQHTFGVLWISKI